MADRLKRLEDAAKVSAKPIIGSLVLNGTAVTTYVGPLTKVSDDLTSFTIIQDGTIASNSEGNYIEITELTFEDKNGNAIPYTQITKTKYKDGKTWNQSNLQDNDFTHNQKYTMRYENNERNIEFKFDEQRIPVKAFIVYAGHVDNNKNDIYNGTFRTPKNIKIIATDSQSNKIEVFSKNYKDFDYKDRKPAYFQFI